MTLASEAVLREATEALNLGGSDGEGRLRALRERYVCDARIHFLLGALLEREGRFGDALIALDGALLLGPDNVQVLSAKAKVLQALGRGVDARLLLTEAVERQPACGQLWTNLGVLQESVDDLEIALQTYDRAIAQQDAPIFARLNRGSVLTRLGRLEQALENNELLAGLQPGYADAHFNVAEVLLALHRYEQALDACNRALAIDPTHVKARIDCALALAAMGRTDEAQTILDRLKQVEPEAMAEFNFGFAARSGGIPDEFGAYSIYFHLVYERVARCDWSRRSELVESIRGRIATHAGTPAAAVDPNLPFRVLGFDIDEAPQHALAIDVAAATRLRAQVHTFTPARGVRVGRRIRIGYVSPDYRIHPCSFLSRRLYPTHDRSRFEVLGYGLAPGDGSWIANEIRSGFDTFRDVSRLDPTDTARCIRDDGIDILVDLAGYTNFSRSETFALRPAPLQVNWLGYPGTLGARYMDYAVVDRVTCPEGADRHWTEKLVRLPHTYFVTDGDPRVNDAPLTRHQAGLPEGAFVFCCFNNSWKIEPRIFSLWMELLKSIPRSVLWLIAFHPEVPGNLKCEAAAAGVDPGRLVFGERLPNESHLPRYDLADLFLDTYYYGAHTTAIDALRQNVPLVTALGERMPARAASSIVTAAGMPELICKDLGEYRDKALALARDPQALAQVRSALQRNRHSSPLFDTPRFVRNLEAAFEAMWNRRLQGLPPAAFDVDEATRPLPAARWF